MNAINTIFITLSLLFCGGYALHKIYITTKTMAIERIQKGMPHMSDFTNRLTCSKLSKSGTLKFIKNCEKRKNKMH